MIPRLLSSRAIRENNRSGIIEIRFTGCDGKEAGIQALEVTPCEG